MKLRDLTYRQVTSATAAVRRQLRDCESAAVRGDRAAAYAAAEMAQHAAYDLKQLFGIEDLELIKNPATTTVGAKVKEQVDEYAAADSE